MGLVKARPNFLGFGMGRTPKVKVGDWVKAGFEGGDYVEHMWVKVTKVGRSSVEGKLDNEPEVMDMKRGEHVKVRFDQIEDVQHENPSAFDRCVEDVTARGSADDPRAVCATAGRAKYGAKRFQEMAAAGRRRRNPLEPAADLSEAWHGRPANKVTEITERLHTHGVLVDLGGMECLEIVDPNDERYVIPIRFGHDVRLCSSEDGKSLYLRGGPQKIDVEPFGVEVDKDLVVLGEAAAITYHTSKAHLGKQDKIPGPYRHVFADENGERPTVLYDCENHLILFAGGTYQIQRDMDAGTHSAGIRN